MAAIKEMDFGSSFLYNEAMKTNEAEYLYGDNGHIL